MDRASLMLCSFVSNLFYQRKHHLNKRKEQNAVKTEVISINHFAGLLLQIHRADQRSNKNTCMHQKPQFRWGKCIKKGQVLADGAATVGGELAWMIHISGSGADGNGFYVPRI